MVGCRCFGACLPDTFLVVGVGVGEGDEITGAATGTRGCPPSANTVTAARAPVPTRPSTVTAAAANATLKRGHARYPDWKRRGSPLSQARRAAEPSTWVFTRSPRRTGLIRISLG